MSIIDNFMKDNIHLNSLYTQHSLPTSKLANVPTDSHIAYELIKSELELETNEKQNLATFCQTYMEPQAEALIKESLSKNLIDKTEYPKVAEFEQRCLKIIEDLWHGTNTVGTSTIGSSEGCMLGGLNMKKRWQQANPDNNKPNLIISSSYQVCWEKFAVYFDVELREIDLNPSNLTLNIDEVINSIDENTIGVIAILGVTYTGLYDNVEQLNTKLIEYNKNAKYPIYIHVDAASGGLFAPFVKTKMKWDFELETVISINCSGHKYGLAYPGIGWVLFKDNDHICQDILFEVSYLGGNVPTMGVNFSHSASHMIAQYYNFTRLGFEGYERIHTKTQHVAKHLFTKLNKMDLFEFYNDGVNLPILCFKMKVKRSWNLYALSDQLLKYGWQIPSYELSKAMDDTTVMRIVVRSDFTFDFVNDLVTDITNTIKWLDEMNLDLSDIKSQSFTH